MPGKEAASAHSKHPKLVGKYQQVRVAFIGASFLTSQDQEKWREVDDRFGIFVLDEIFRRQSILSNLRGMLKKTHHCRKCDSDLMGLKAHRRRFALEILYRQLPPFKLEIEMPAIPCRSCGTANAINEQRTEDAISGAIAQAFLSLRKKQS